MYFNHRGLRGHRVYFSSVFSVSSVVIKILSVVIKKLSVVIKILIEAYTVGRRSISIEICIFAKNIRCHGKLSRSKK
jgi:hypothetical protein